MNIIQMSLTASTLIAAVVIIRAFTLYKLPKITFLALWGVVVLRLLVPISASSRFSLYTGLDRLKGLFAENTSLIPQKGTAGISRTIGSGAEQSASVDVSSSLGISFIGITWVVGIALCLLFFIVTYIKSIRKFKTALPIENDFVTVWQQENPLHRPVQIRQSDHITSPLTYGIFHPVVLLPKNTDWTNEVRLRYILAHEYAHIRRFDVLKKLVLTVAVCIHWFNPLVWLMYILANRDIELSCDETVVQSYGETIKSAYAFTLIELKEQNKRFAPFIISFKKNAIEERIVSIMKIRKFSTLTIAFAVILIFGTVTVFATNALDTEDDQAEDSLVERDVNDIPYQEPKPFIVNTSNSEGGIDEEGIGEEVFPDEITPLNINTQEARTLAKGKSKTYAFNVKGSWGAPDNDAVSVVITLESGESYHYISENVTQGQTLASQTYGGDASRTLSNLNPSDKYEITIINLGASPLKYTISITSYIQ